jgi:hypothetical protein
MNVVKRWKSKTPKFFKRLRNVGLALCAAGATILAAPVALPACVITAAGYVAVAGSVMVAVSQAVVEGERCE